MRNRASTGTGADGGGGGGVLRAGGLPHPVVVALPLLVLGRPPATAQQQLRQRLRELSEAHPRYGYPSATSPALPPLTEKIERVDREDRLITRWSVGCRRLAGQQAADPLQDDACLPAHRTGET